MTRIAQTLPNSNRETIEAWSKNLRRKLKPSITTEEILEQIIDEIKAREELALKESIKAEIKEMNLKPTANPAFMIDNNGKYYRFDKNKFVPESSVENIDEQGNYTVITNIDNQNDLLQTTYDINHKPVTFKVINSENRAYDSAQYVAKKLNMKQEFVKQHKLHGYCGNSSGISAVIKNMISEPKPSGCYFDKSYNFFSWNKKNKQFEIQLRNGNKLGSPMIADYEFKQNIVIRTDYDGAGIFF